jgi:hypothetical protein
VPTAEDYADGVVRAGLLSVAATAATAAVPSVYRDGAGSYEEGVCYAAAAARDVVALRVEADTVAANIRSAVAYSLGLESERAGPERAAQVSLIREFLGNPFRPVALDPAVLYRNERTIPRLAGAIYNERSLPDGTLDDGRLAILADALEEAGCHDAPLLAHLRGPGPHVRGCWALDTLLWPEGPP